MPNFNKVILAGHLTRDPEARYTQNGTCVTNFGIAVNNRFKKGQNWVDDPLFLEVTLFGKSAETAAERYKKGEAVLVDGSLRCERWEDKQKQKREKIVVIADRLVPLSPKSSNPSNSSCSENERVDPPNTEEMEEQDDIPF